MNKFLRMLSVIGKAFKKTWNWINKRPITRRIFIAMIAVPMLITGISNKRASNSFAQPTPTPEPTPYAIDRRSIIADNLAYTTEEVTGTDEEAAFIAKVLYGTAKNNSEEDQILCVWCILNRVEDERYPNTVSGVCQQKSQWMGYSDDNPVIRNLYELALSQLTIWRNDGIRPCGPEYIFMSWSKDKITLRNTFEETAQTRYHS